MVKLSTNQRQRKPVRDGGESYHWITADEPDAMHDELVRRVKTRIEGAPEPGRAAEHARVTPRSEGACTARGTVWIAPWPP